MRALQPIVLIGVLGASTVSAVAYCDSRPTVEQEFKTSAVVCIGKVTDAREVAVRSQSVTGGTFYSIEVVEVLKGGASRSLQLYSERSSGRFPMQVGVQYLIFAESGTFEGISGQQLGVNSCGNSAPLPKGHKTLETVRRLRKA